MKMQKLKRQVRDLQKMGDSKEVEFEKERIQAQIIRMRDSGVKEPEIDDVDEEENKEVGEKSEANAFLDMTMSVVTQVASSKGSNNMKRLNDFEREYGKILNINTDLLQREDLTMTSIAKLKLLNKFQNEFSAKEKASLWNQFQAI